MTYRELIKKRNNNAAHEKYKADYSKLTAEELAELDTDIELLLLLSPSAEKDLSTLAKNLPRRLKFTGPRPWLDKLHAYKEKKGENNDNNKDKPSL